MIFAIIAGGIAKIFDISLIKKKFSLIKYFKDTQNWNYLKIGLSGIVLLLIGAVLKSRFSIPVSLYFASGAFILMGILGLIPFSFVKERDNKESNIFLIPPIISRCMGKGALSLSVIAFLLGFFYVLITGGPKDIPIAIAMGVVCFPAGVLLGIFLGMIIGYIIKKLKK